MLLSLFRLTMIVSLLISAVCIEPNKDSSSIKNKAVAVSERRDTFPKEDVSVDNHEKTVVQKRQSSKHNRYSNDQDPRSRRGSVSSTERRGARADEKGLANKMAKDALKSPKMQETIRKLGRVSSKFHSNQHTLAKMSASAKSVGKRIRSEHKGNKHKGRRKTKSKRHRGKYRKGHSWPKRGSSKRTSNPAGDNNSLTKELTRKEKSVIKCNQAITDDKSRDEPSTSRSDVRVTHLEEEDSNYVDFSSPMNIESLVSSSESPENDSPAKLSGDERMIDKLMRTTTRDPSKKNPGDQGIEYSDYYSDDDVLEDIAANKIPMQIARSRNSNDRVARQTANIVSHRRIDRHVPPQHRNHVARRKDFKYRGNAARHSANVRGYPKKRFVGSNRNPRFLIAGDSSGSIDDRYEHLDPLYFNEDKIQEHTPKKEKEKAVLDVLQDNVYTSDDDVGSDDIQQQNPDQFNYLNQYEVPEEGDFQSMDFDQTMMNQPGMENVIPSSTTKDINGGYEAQLQPSFPAGQLYGNLEQAQDQAGKSVSIQGTNNFPQTSVNNAMDQPLGKILESLGINIDTDSSGTNQNSAANGAEKGPVLYPDSLERPEDHVFRAGYLNAEMNRNEKNNARGWNRAVQSRKRKMQGHPRRHLIENDGYDNEFSSYTDDPGLHSNISVAVQDTKEVAGQILDTIMEELEELKLNHSKNNKKEGSWSTAQAGVKLDMRVENRTISVTVTELATPPYHESLLNGTWNVSGHAPFKRGSPFTLIATENSTRSIAVFVGSCRVCQGVDTIAGVWSVARQPNNCRDFQVATSVFNDIFRKTKLSSLKEDQNSTTIESVTLNHDKRKS